MSGTFWNLKLNAQGTKLAYAETFVVLHHVLPLADVTANDNAIERGVNFHFCQFQLCSVKFRLGAFHFRTLAVQIVLRAFGLKFRLFEISVAAQSIFAKFLLAAKISALGF